MKEYHLKLFNLELSFKGKDAEGILERACLELEKRYNAVAQTGGHLSKEKLLAYLALALAADFVQLQDAEKLRSKSLESLLHSIEEIRKKEYKNIP